MEPKTMRANHLLSLLLLAVIGLFCNLSPPVLADDHENLTKIHDLLRQAWGVDADTPPSDEQRLDFLKQALDEIKSFPPGNYYTDLYYARRLVENAILEIGKGDPDHRVVQDIKDADERIRSIN